MEGTSGWASRSAGVIESRSSAIAGEEGEEEELRNGVMEEGVMNTQGSPVSITLHGIYVHKREGTVIPVFANATRATERKYQPVRRPTKWYPSRCLWVSSPPR